MRHSMDSSSKMVGSVHVLSRVLWYIPGHLGSNVDWFHRGIFVLLILYTEHTEIFDTHHHRWSHQPDGALREGWRNNHHPLRPLPGTGWGRGISIQASSRHKRSTAAQGLRLRRCCRRSSLRGISPLDQECSVGIDPRVFTTQGHPYSGRRYQPLPEPSHRACSQQAMLPPAHP